MSWSNCFLNLQDKPDIWDRQVVTQRKCEREGLVICVPHTRDKSELASTERDTKPQLKAAGNNNVKTHKFTQLIITLAIIFSLTWGTKFAGVPTRPGFQILFCGLQYQIHWWLIVCWRQRWRITVQWPEFIPCKPMLLQWTKISELKLYRGLRKYNRNKDKMILILLHSLDLKPVESRQEYLPWLLLVASN